MLGLERKPRSLPEKLIRLFSRTEKPMDRIKEVSDEWIYERRRGRYANVLRVPSTFAGKAANAGEVPPETLSGVCGLHGP